MSLNLLSIGSHTQEDPSAYHMTAWRSHQTLNPDKQVTHATVVLADALFCS